MTWMKYGDVEVNDVLLFFFISRIILREIEAEF